MGFGLWSGSDHLGAFAAAAGWPFDEGCVFSSWPNLISGVGIWVIWPAFGVSVVLGGQIVDGLKCSILATCYL